MDHLERTTQRSIGKLLHYARRGKGMTLKQMAQITGLSISLLSQVERGETVPSFHSLFTIVWALVQGDIEPEEG